MRLSSKSVVAAALAAFPFLLATASHAKNSDHSTIISRGEMLSLSCAGCHGTDGKSESVIPTIYGRSAKYIESALLDFKSGARPSTVMERHAKGYSDEQIHQIAEYFGALSSKNN
ncbi:MAG TPA: sulfide dehydrogenase [Chlorobaculum parvum]|uniref:Sulfide dehydrogenase n=1 Tax=Chlorobaculum parvum TaxID=274539 RepID=A0A7C5DFT3_9CHLB|nr:sulfide dehydrogenase [Chlorobaculum parvum]